jgi:hypothetical protein
MLYHLVPAEFPNMGAPKFDGTTTTGNDYKVCSHNASRQGMQTGALGCSLDLTT